MIIYNGEVLSAADAPSVLLNRSFRYGDGLFETLRVYQGQILFLPQHLQRLQGGMAQLGMKPDTPDWIDSLQAALLRSVTLHELSQHGRLRLHVFRQGAGAYAPVDDRPAYLVEGFSLKHDPYQEAPALRLTTYEEWPLSPTPLSPFKTASALPYVLAARYARQHGYDDALLFHQDLVVEASSSSLFLVSQRKLYTPPLRVGPLAGIMRATILQVAQEVKVPAQEKKIRLREVLQADEVFLTNTIKGIQPVAQIQEHIYSASPGPITQFLRNCLHQYIERSL